MTHFRNYTPEKYNGPDYEKIEEGIYRTKDPYNIVKNGMVYVTSLSFQMEPERYGEEEATPWDIPQLPFEDLLDEYMVFVTDFYEDLNRTSQVTCYQEFGSSSIEEIRELRTIIGKRFYAVPCGEDNEDFDADCEEDLEGDHRIVIEDEE